MTDEIKHFQDGTVKKIIAVGIGFEKVQDGLGDV